MEELIYSSNEYETLEMPNAFIKDGILSRRTTIFRTHTDKRCFYCRQRIKKLHYTLCDTGIYNNKVYKHCYCMECANDTISLNKSIITQDEFNRRWNSRKCGKYQ